MRARGGEEEEEDEQEEGLWACQAREGALIWYYEGQTVVNLGSVQEPPTVTVIQLVLAQTVALFLENKESIWMKTGSR